jgi:hypothetical protein
MLYSVESNGGELQCQESFGLPRQKQSRRESAVFSNAENPVNLFSFSVDNSYLIIHTSYKLSNNKSNSRDSDSYELADLTFSGILEAVEPRPAAAAAATAAESTLGKNISVRSQVENAVYLIQVIPLTLFFRSSSIPFPFAVNYCNWIFCLD